MTKSLAEYAKEVSTARGRSCSTCLLPPETLTQVNDAIRQRISRRVIRQWLLEEVLPKGSDFPGASLDNHVARGHVEGYER